jgi:hypothetical protein
MNKRRVAIAAAGGAAVAALIVGAVPVGAQEEPSLLPVSVTPTSGPAGTVATLSGDGCIGEGGPGDIEAYLWDPSTVEGDPPDLFWSGEVASDGTWTAGVEFEGTDPLGIYFLSATCFVDPESSEIVADYDFVEFELTATDPTPAPEPTPDPAPAPQPTSKPTRAPEAATPAAPVAGDPDYTG